MLLAQSSTSTLLPSQYEAGQEAQLRNSSPRNRARLDLRLAATHQHLSGVSSPSPTVRLLLQYGQKSMLRVKVR